MQKNSIGKYRECTNIRKLLKLTSGNIKLSLLSNKQITTENSENMSAYNVDPCSEKHTKNTNHRTEELENILKAKIYNKRDNKKYFKLRNSPAIYLLKTYNQVIKTEYSRDMKLTE